MDGHQFLTLPSVIIIMDAMRITAYFSIIFGPLSQAGLEFLLQFWGATVDLTEITLGIICACIPTLRPLFVACLPRSTSQRCFREHPVLREDRGGQRENNNSTLPYSGLYLEDLCPLTRASGQSRIPDNRDNETVIVDDLKNDTAVSKARTWHSAVILPNESYLDYGVLPIQVSRRRSHNEL